MTTYNSFSTSCLVIIVALVSLLVADEYRLSNSCTPKWMEGKRASVCSNMGLTEIPRTLDTDIQLLDLRDNNITHLVSEAFLSVNMVNLHKLYLQNCNIQDIHEDAFKGLKILIELNLSNNRIHLLYPGTFHDLIKIREIYLNYNLLRKLEDGLFTNLPFLSKVEIAECQLQHISPKTFVNVSGLRTLILNSNKLSNIRLQAVEDLEKLTSLELNNNPWRCDCTLRPFIEWTVARKLYVKPTSCAEPAYLLKRYWSDVDPDQFACKPQIMYPHAGDVISVSSESTVLRCRVLGDPYPEIDWVYQSRIISNNSRSNYPHSQGYHHYVVRDEEWSNLTLVNLSPSDARGEFKCVAKNPAGIQERNVTLRFSEHKGIIGTVADPESGLLMVILLCGIIILFCLIILLCCCCYRKHSDESLKPKKSTSNGHSPINGDVMHHITADSTEQGKSLLTIVNPVQKPPRRYDQNSPSGATEMTELSRKLLDDHNLNDDDSRLGDFRDDNNSTPNGRRSALDSKYPPDLLSFPPNLRTAQSSPAGSSGSNVPPPMNDMRIPRMSPIHSPTNIYGTLPYSRSQSPFNPLVGGYPVQQKQGYVTLPRKPRGSWSAAPTPTIEPVYDTLGRRTTVNGSINSLNTMDPARRQLPNIPNTPNSRHSLTLPHKMNTLPHNYRTAGDPSREPELKIHRPMPILKSPDDRYRSLPRGYSPSPLDPTGQDNFRRPLSPNRFPSEDRIPGRRSSWSSRATPEPTSVNGSSDTINLIPASSRKFTPIALQQKMPVQNHRISPTSQTARNSPLPFSNSPVRRSPNGNKPPISPMRKLTPVPSQVTPNSSVLPPKTKSIEILFEDEGEDGTEV